MEAGPTPARSALAVLLLAALPLVAGCSDGATLPAFPHEKSAADFPGRSYPSYEGELPSPGSLHGPVWLVGIDGASWDLILPLVERGELPHFASMLAEGAHGPLLSEEPTISPALWATIVTGTPRFEHGIVDFLTKLPGRYDEVEVGPPDRLSPALWELVDAAGGSSAVISWFGSYPAERIRGVYVSKGFDPENLHPEQVHPESLVARLRSGARVRIDRRDFEQIGKTDFLRRTLLEDARTMAALRLIAADLRPDLVAVYLSGLDVVQHVTWRHMDPTSQQFPQDGSPVPELAGVIPAYYRFIDRALGEIATLAPEETTLVVVSDHGAGPLQPEEAFHFQLGVLLEQLGLARGHDGTGFTLGDLYRHDKRIWLNVEGVEERGIVPAEQSAAEAARIRERLEALRSDAGGPLLESVIDHTRNPQWRPGEAALTVRFSSLALLTSEVIDGDRRFDFSSVPLRHTDVSGAHRPEGVVLLRGPGIRPGRLDAAASIYQIAPTVLYLLGMPQDARMLRHAPERGGVLEAAVEADVLQRQPLRMVREYPGTDRTALVRGRGAVEDPARREALEKLRSLGYIR
jgi:predicted AlkP superfamily phosphohydrolase/phosphomutase